MESARIRGKKLHFMSCEKFIRSTIHANLHDSRNDVYQIKIEQNRRTYNWFLMNFVFIIWVKSLKSRIEVCPNSISFYCKNVNVQRKLWICFLLVIPFEIFSYFLLVSSVDQFAICIDLLFNRYGLSLSSKIFQSEINFYKAYASFLTLKINIFFSNFCHTNKL